MKHIIISKLQRKVPLSINLINKSKHLFSDCCIVDPACSKRAPWTLKLRLYEKSDFVDIQELKKSCLESVTLVCLHTVQQKKKRFQLCKTLRQPLLHLWICMGTTRKVITQFENFLKAFQLAFSWVHFSNSREPS